MRIKLDENLGKEVAIRFRRAGHDVATVKDENLCSTDDRTLIEICRKEKRCIVTLDIEFGNPLIFKPSMYAGIAVLRLPRKPLQEDLLNEADILIERLKQANITGKLWVVQRGRIREYQEENDDEFFG